MNRRNPKGRPKMLGIEKKKVESKLLDSPPLFKVPGKIAKRKLEEMEGERYTSWEILNFILRGLVNQLVKIGVPSSIKKTVFQLWTYYLRQVEVAFVCENDDTALPKLDAHFNKQDLEQLYGLKIIHRKNKKFEFTPLGYKDWRSTAVKKHLEHKMKKKSLQEAVQMSIVGNLGSNSWCIELPETFDDRTNQDKIIGCSLEGNPVLKLTKCHFNTKTKEIMEQQNCSDGALLALKKKNPAITLNKFKLMVILYLGLLYERCDVHISDLIRWIREGHMCYNNISHFLPENCSIPLKITEDRYLMNYGAFLEHSTDVCRFIGMAHWPIPDWSKIAYKYVKELQLPAKFGDLILKIIHLDLKTFCTKNIHSLPNYEGRVLAVLIIIMKLLFGLDGKTEHKISEVASKWNSLLGGKKNRKTMKLFVWNDWVKHIICRDAVLTKYHFPSKQAISPEISTNPECFISYWWTWKDLYGSRMDRHKFSYSNLRDIRPGLVDYFDKILDEITETECIIDKGIVFPPSLTPYSVYTQNIVQKCRKSKSFIKSEANAVLSKNFTKRDLNYLLNPDKLIEQAKKNNGFVKVRLKSAQKKFSSYVSEKRQKIVWLPYRSYVSVTHCSQRRKRFLNKEKVQGSFQFSLNRSELIQKLVNEARKSVFSSKKRKRRTSSGPKSSKKKKMDTKKSNILKLNLPYSQYWIIHEENCTSEGFDALFIKFPFSFSWLLSECALLSEMSNVLLYKEVMFLEKTYKNLFVSSCENKRI